MIRGKVHKYGDHIDTDAIVPAVCAELTDPEALGRHCMQHIDPEFAARVKPGDVIVGGENFGCGSSREIAPLAIQGAKVAAVVAKSFARIFFRNAINIGLPVVVSPEAAEKTKAGDELEIDLVKGQVKNLSQGLAFPAAPYPDFINDLVAGGGLVEYVKKRLKT